MRFRGRLIFAAIALRLLFTGRSVSVFRSGIGWPEVVDGVGEL